MPFKSKKQRKYLEMIAHNPESARKPAEDVESIKKFVAESEKMLQPTIEKVKPKFSKIMSKMKKK